MVRRHTAEAKAEAAGAAAAAAAAHCIRIAEGGRSGCLSVRVVVLQVSAIG